MKNPVLHEGVQVIGCDCGGCYGEIDTPYVAMTRSTYDAMMAEDEATPEEPQAQDIAYADWLNDVESGRISITLEDYRAWMEYDGNLYWRLDSGVTQSLLEQAIEEIDKLKEKP